jgi:hypothetical protein
MNEIWIEIRHVNTSYYILLREDAPATKTGAELKIKTTYIVRSGNKALMRVATFYLSKYEFVRLVPIEQIRYLNIINV